MMQRRSELEKRKKDLTVYRIIRGFCSVFTAILMTATCLMPILGMLFSFEALSSYYGIFTLCLAMSCLLWWYIYMEKLLPRLDHKIRKLERPIHRMPHELQNILDEVREALEMEIWTPPENHDTEKAIPTTKELKINEYITVKLEDNLINIYVLDKIFIQCKYLLLDILKEDMAHFDHINSIDDLSIHLDHDLEYDYGRKVFVKEKYGITPEIEFFAHCSNLQAWYEYGYDTRILHSNLSFPLLKRLTEVGDQDAKRVFKEEIAKRFVEGNKKVRQFLNFENYLGYLNIEEILSIVRTILEKEDGIKLNVNRKDKKKEFIGNNELAHSEWDLIEDEFTDFTENNDNNNNNNGE